MARRREAEQRAHQLLKKYDIRKLPVPVDEIALGEGAQIIRQRFQGTESGFALRQDARKIIGVNASTSPRRQRFTIAHELGHLIIHDSRALTVDNSVRLYQRNDLSSMATDDDEMEANAFAAALLMPREQVVKEVGSLYEQALGREELVTRLARRFNVSIEALSYRLINLGLIST
jgi:Zn-dependent peptidase ImmA (M78 family)